jgi:hypothetical protein
MLSDKDHVYHVIEHGKLKTRCRGMFGTITNMYGLSTALRWKDQVCPRTMLVECVALTVSGNGKATQHHVTIAPRAIDISAELETRNLSQYNDQTCS